jgi:hypothetical protein
MMSSRLTAFTAVACLVSLCMAPAVFAAATSVPISGEIERITIKNLANPWSGGEMVVGGYTVILPANLLMDLPANRLTLQQLFLQAPAACVAAGETGLAKTDTCNLSGVGGFATISANRVQNGNVIAGDVLIEKGRELTSGVVTYISYTDGYFRVNGILNDPTTGVMVRLNDPTARHTIQQGLGCAAAGPGFPNCSPDPRFTLDPDNYTNVFSTGYPVCIPSTVPRRFVDVLDLNNDGNTTRRLTARSNVNGNNDLLCPNTNRTNAATEPPVADSRRFAPIKLRDSLTAEGNFETINGVRFLSAHTVQVLKGLTTSNLPNQPDYLFLDEVGIDAPGFQNQRIRSLIIGFATLSTDVLLWTIHYDPVANAAHEVPWASVLGCDAVGGAGTCGAVGLQGVNNIFKIRHDVDFVAANNKKAELNPCSILNAEARFGAVVCDPLSVADQFDVLSPIPHEIIARTGKKLANPGLLTIDIQGNQATNGEYLFPFGVNLGGIGFPEFVEIDLNARFTPYSFSGIPWNLDRRLSPGGCQGACETTPQPLNPFPWEEIDPRTQAVVPHPDRILSFFPFAVGDVLAWPPAAPAFSPIVPTPPTVFSCAAAPTTATVAGRVTVAPRGVAGARNVTMTLTDTATGTPITTALTTFAGSYTFTGLANGAYTITPSRGVNTFTPPSADIVVTAPGSVTGPDFTMP